VLEFSVQSQEDRMLLLSAVSDFHRDKTNALTFDPILAEATQQIASPAATTAGGVGGVKPPLCAVRPG
jgi:hypothetical protein